MCRGTSRHVSPGTMLQALLLLLLILILILILILFQDYAG
jgi:hypothetical protein